MDVGLEHIDTVRFVELYTLGCGWGTPWGVGGAHRVVWVGHTVWCGWGTH